MRKTLAFALAATLASYAPRAYACGCFAPPSTVTPVVQAGERILFARDGGTVTAYIQIQYQGSAQEFGWLVPLPSVPTLQLGTEELFDQLELTTRPTFQLTTTYQRCDGTSNTYRSSGGCNANYADTAPSVGGNAADMGASAADMGLDNTAVVRASIGPFDYAVLKADDKTALLDWLNTNKYFVPVGTDSAVDAYIHPGAYFLALKLRAGESAGDVVPVILKYASDLPMIPIILTSVGAIPDMGIQVFMLGEHRAIPRNYRHIVLNDLAMFQTVPDYNRLLIKAVREAPLHHAFITEYAGTSSPMVGVLDYTGRFGTPAGLKATPDPSAYLTQLRTRGFRFDATLINLLANYLPVPEAALAQGISPAFYYLNYDSFAWSRETVDMGAVDGGAPPPPPFDPVALTDALWMRIVEPTLATGQLFKDHPYLTRMVTALSPEDMTADPVFSENPDLPTVAALHTATLTFPCRGQGYLLSDQSGLQTQYPFTTANLPATLRLETLRESGQPIIDVDNHEVIRAKIGPVDHGSMNAGDRSGCSASDLPRGDRGMLLLVGAAIFFARRVRRKSA